ncbi:hypothetical protein FH609_004935 [Streptomyces sp. 3MP-14]|uniref:SnoaL-like domain-containing protein n=1 Tax=Streptomyces mimosae TaxID=2586635 RepID=A0A5N6ANJ4_9ACTN|nr:MULTISPECIES: hypothetical protein [Streptomyces]KAB8169653.1 hypothetical protein FH607_002615 [Streptomyces mimosae]KAB8178401.1 hypothetical protein FH609_004935 [Streptomyces sp. 3MP-14]
MNTDPRRPGALTRQAVDELIDRALAALAPWNEPDALLRLLSRRGLVVHLPHRDLRGPGAVRAWAHEFVRTRELRCRPIGAPEITLTSPLHAGVLLDVGWAVTPRGGRAPEAERHARVELSLVLDGDRPVIRTCAVHPVTKPRAVEDAAPGAGEKPTTHTSL